MADRVNRIQTQCCVVGGGPAGMVLGYLLARAGVEVVVLEKHADFLRDFRGDTVHPSTLEIMYELGLLDSFLARPHQEVRELSGIVNGEPVAVVDFSHLSTHCKFTVLMPQWDFLNFLAEQAAKFPSFALRAQTRAIGLLEKDGHVTGVRAETNQGPLEINANLVVAADGRHSDLRQAANLEVVDFGAPIDVLWMRISRHPGDPEATAGRFSDGHILVMLNRGDYWQCAFVLAKGGHDELRAAGLPAFREQLVRLAPFLRERIGELDAWEKIKLLTVAVNRLRRWAKPGLLLIGDAAHAMSPVGGVGINLAVQDAVAAANLLHRPLLNGVPTLSELEEVQKRREWPTQMTQRVQIFLHKNILERALASGAKTKQGDEGKLPVPLRVIRRLTFLRRVPARLFGMGFRPEHVAPDILGASRATQA